MKKTIMTLLVVLVVCGALGAAVYFLSRPEPAPSLGDIYTEDDRINIFSYSAADVQEFSIANPSGSFALYKINGEWQMRGFEGLPVLVQMVDAVVYNFTNVRSEQCIEAAPENLAPYGLDAPQITFRIVLLDGEKTFYIGNVAPNGSEYYFNTDTSRDVYTMEAASVDLLMSKARDFTEFTATTIEVGDLSEVAITRHAGGETLRIRVREGGARDSFGVLSYWDILEPYRQNAGNDAVYNNITKYVAALEDNAIAFYANTAEQRAAYHLDNPAYTLYVDNTVIGPRTYAVSEEMDGVRYLARSDSEYIFSVAKDNIDFVETGAYAITERYVALVEIKNLKSVVITEEDGTVTHLAAQDPEGENSQYYIEGQMAATEKFKDFYQQLIALRVAGVAEQAERGTLRASIRYTLTDDEEILVEFYDYDDRNYAVFADGTCDFYCNKKEVDRMLTALDAFRTDYN